MHARPVAAATLPSRGATTALRTAVLALSIGLLALPCLAGSTTSAGTITPSRPDWATGLTLMLSDVSTPSALHKAVEVIQSLGGRVGVINEPDIVFGWISPTQHAALLRAGFRTVSTDIVSPAALAGASANTIEAARFLNAVSSGEFFTRASPARSVPRGPDVVAPGANVAADILNDGMTGYVNVAMLFIESVYVPGVPDSEDLYSWDYQSFYEVYDATWAGLMRWSSMASSHGVTLYFSLGAGYPWGEGSWLQQPYEPIHQHSWGDYNMWLEPVMANFSYTQGTGPERVAAWNEWRRQASGADHATTYVMVKNDASNPVFSGQIPTSAALPGGPFVQMPYLYAIGNDAEQAHELGHIFWACDEYAGSHCECVDMTCTGWGSTVPRYWVLNCNCANCPNHTSCIMDAAAATVVCPFTAQRIGWTPAYGNCGQ